MVGTKPIRAFGGIDFLAARMAETDRDIAKTRERDGDTAAAALIALTYLLRVESDICCVVAYFAGSCTATESCKGKVKSREAK